MFQPKNEPANTHPSGLSLFIAELTGVYFTGGSLNPARSFAPAVVNRSFEVYHWIYWLGPVLGALLAASFYKFIKMLEYETANPAADDFKDPERAFNPDNDHSHPRVSFDPARYVAAAAAADLRRPASRYGDQVLAAHDGADDRPYTANDTVVGSHTPPVGTFKGTRAVREFAGHSSLARPIATENGPLGVGTLGGLDNVPTYGMDDHSVDRPMRLGGLDNMQ